MERLAGVVILVLASLLSGCSYLRPVFLSGDDGQAFLENGAVAMIAARFPEIAIGHARCPFLMDLTGDRGATCTLPTTAGPMRITIAGSHRFGTYDVRDVDALVVRHDTEAQIADALGNRYGVPFLVHCNRPQAEILPVRAMLTCAIDAAGIHADRIDVEVLDRYGSLYVPDLASGDTVGDRLLGREEQTEGIFEIDGRRVERYLRATVGGSMHQQLVRRKLLGTVRCPARIRIVGLEHVHCAASIGDQRLDLGLRFDQGRGLVFDRYPTIVITDQTASLMTRMFARLLKPDVVHVDCGSAPVRLVEIGGSVGCTVHAKQGELDIHVRVVDGAGTLELEPETAGDGA